MEYNPIQMNAYDPSRLPIEPKLQVPYQRMREMTLDDLLLENRIVFMIGEINYRRATEVIMKLLYLDNLKRGVEISLYINSPGGSVDDTMAIYDTMRFIGSPMATYCIGRAQSGGGGHPGGGHQGQTARPAARQGHAAPALGRRHRPGRRHPHPGRGNPAGQADDQRILSKHTGLTPDKINRRDRAGPYMTAEEALKTYGLIDEVLKEGRSGDTKRKQGHVASRAAGNSRGSKSNPIELKR
jgi:ATP-dependent Clp protease, protease subunit